MEEQSTSRRQTSVLARRPEIVPVTVSAVAWLVLLALPAAGGHGGHTGVFTASGLAMVAGMTIAMMAPLAIPGVRAVATRLRSGAGRGIVAYVAAFLLTWTVIALCLAPFAETLGGVLGSPVTAAGILTLLCVLAVLNQRRSTGRQDSAMDSPGHGRGEVIDCALYGCRNAGRGFRSCALPMLAMLALPGSLLLMAVLTGLVVADRFTTGRQRLVIAALYTVLGLGLLGAGLLR